MNNIESAGNTLTAACHSASRSAGWWHGKDGTPLWENPLIFSNKLCLIHSEISEAMEGDRKRLKDNHLPQYDMRAVELADAAIRIFDLAGAYGYSLGEIIAAKMAYNAQRADHKIEARASVNGKAY